MDNKEFIYKSLGYQPTIVNARFIKPLDRELLMSLCKTHDHIVTIEEGALNGGFGSAVGSFLHDNKLANKLSRMGIPDDFTQHGTRNELLMDVGLSSDKLISIINHQHKNKRIYEF